MKTFSNNLLPGILAGAGATVLCSLISLVQGGNMPKSANDLKSNGAILAGVSVCNVLDLMLNGRYNLKASVNKPAIADPWTQGHKVDVELTSKTDFYQKFAWATLGSATSLYACHNACNKNLKMGMLDELGLVMSGAAVTWLMGNTLGSPDSDVLKVISYTTYPPGCGDGTIWVEELQVA